MLDLPITQLDLAALLVFLVTTAGYGYISGLAPLERRSISGAVQRHRERWMDNMAVRDTRIVDGQLLAGLAQGNAFFASTSAIIIGGLAAMLGSGDKVQSLLERLPWVAQSSAMLFEIKLLLLIVIFIFAFFKFAWAFRLSHYVAIMIGSTPILDHANRSACQQHARRTARVIGLAAEHANTGLRAYYYAIAAMAWFFHPVAFIAATLWVLAILVRREFFSRSRRVMSEI